MKRVLLVACALLPGCTRHADIRDEPDASLANPNPTLDAGDIPPIDGALDGYPACEGRPEGDCRGANDFLCDMDRWVEETAEKCQQQTGCKTNGWLEVEMGDDGCVATIGLDQPNGAMVQCLAEVMGTVRCPCSKHTSQHFFGLANDGCD